MSPEQRLQELGRLMARAAAGDGEGGLGISLETLLDLLLCLFYECSSARVCRDQTISGFLQRVTPFITRVKELRLHREDFEILKVIGRGAFGEVAVVKLKETEKVFAMKILHKWEMLKRADAACFREERDILVKGRGRWITTLHYAFQDELYLYLIMDYYAGGDLLTLLSKFEDRLPEDLARFYVAEMVLAIDSIHQLNYVHRDIKPDNVLIDVSGHIRLADFGSCLRLRQDGTVETSMAVGTPDYISPEILQAMEDGKGKYGTECDWWSLGVCIYELLFGETPFYAESLVETYGKIMNHKDKLTFPPDADNVSEGARDLIGRLVCSKDKRLGQAGIGELQRQPFFAGIDWEGISNRPPPYVPEVASPTDTSNFDLNDNVLKPWDAAPPSSRGAFCGLHLPFVGFTYTSCSSLSDRARLGDALGTVTLDHGEAEATGRGIKQARRGSKELGSGLRESQVDTADGARRVGAAPGPQVRLLEEELSSVRQQRDEALKEASGLQEELSSRSRELRETRSQLEREARESAERRSELRARLREREGELEAAREKVRSLQRELDRTVRAKEEVEGRARGEAARQRTLLARTEQRRQQLSSEFGRLKVGPSRSPEQEASAPGRDPAMVAEGLAGEEDEASRREGAPAGELRDLREQLEESEGRCRRLEAEVSACGEQLETAQRERDLARREALQELTETHEEETQQLREECGKLRAEAELLGEQLEKLQAANRHLEEELGAAQGRRESASQWDSQIAEIIQWVSEEKEARGYLHSLTNRMTEELESLRRTGGPAKPADQDWRSRRLQRVEASARLELQSALEAEIRAKQLLREQLTEAKAGGLLTECKLQDAEKEIESLKQELASLKEEAEVRSQRGLQQGPLLTFLPRLSDEVPDFSASSHLSPDGRKSPGGKGPLTGGPAAPGVGAAESSAEPLSPRTSVKKPTSPAPRGPPVTKPTPHQFKVQSFRVPTKCMRCTSLMVGLIRQGVVCEVCHYSCHAGCSAGAVGCPAPLGQLRSLGIDPSRGTGTALEGSVSVPRPAGVRRGWQRAFAVLSDCRLLVFEAAEPKGTGTGTGTGAAHIFDLRDEGFFVSSVLPSDVIHANKKDVPCIFRVTASQLRVPSTKTTLLILVENESEKRKWVTVINELVSICRQNGLQERLVLEATEAYDNTLPLISNVQTAAILDRERIALGTDEGLYLLHVTRNELTLLGDRKRVHLLVPVPGSGLLAAVAGRGRSLRLYGRPELATKVREARGAQLLAAGPLSEPGSGCLCLANRRQVSCWRLEAGPPVRWRPLRELQAPGPVQWMGLFGERLCLGYPSGFSLWPLRGPEPARELVSPGDPALGFLSRAPADALCAAPLSPDLFLLCFSTVGVFVDAEGRRAQREELMWPAAPLAAACNGSYLTVYSENMVNVFSVKTAEWVQTIPLKKVRPLSADGSLNLAAGEPVRLVYLRSEERGRDSLVVSETPSSGRRQLFRTGSKRQFAFRISEEDRVQQWREMLKDPQARSKLISNPTNFSHVVHVGPGQPTQNLRDRPLPVNSPDEKGQAPFNLPMFRHRSNTESGLLGFLSSDKASSGSAASSSSTRLPRKQISMDSASLTDF
ncbi:serine/threonine-protein kinase MRCK alpha-like isoform X2 [Pristis pectinata]|uniref:serine/threonine-protein kinase MRCK alpha-like isoform X2 n=1 Tax=Pristis pectinata TaxID=685728 RepID=UPI00223D457F|nr:serine/threonine-protein kinase MRCK alpha-like isoform X2 [Pristis pectinata]